MKYSLIIATLNRPQLLYVCVSSLLKQTYQDFEILIIDQSDKGNESFNIQSLSKKIKYYHIDIRGLSHARNYAINRSLGKYIALIDDDAEYQSDYLEKVNHILNIINPTVIGGQLKDPSSGDMKYGMLSKKIYYKNAFSCFCSPGMIVEGDFQRSHLYDEQFGVGSIYGSGEETDIVLAALHEKKTVFYSADIIIYHPVETMENVIPEKISSYSYGYGALCKKMYCRYSKFWGKYFLYKTTLGNYLYGLVLKYIKKEKKIGEIRIDRARMTYKGFKQYRYKE